MKNIISFFTFLSIFIFSSCEKDDSLDPRPVVVSGNYARLDITEKFMNLDKINDFYFGGVITTPGQNIKTYELYVRLTTDFLVTPFPYVKIPLVIDSFPYELKITPQLLATTFNVPVATFKNKDSFDFLGYAYDSNGVRFDYNSLSAVIKSQPSSKQAFKFTTKIFNNVAFVDQRLPVNYSKFDNYAL